MLVASSNNSAVENITKELPASGKLGAGLRDSLSYFRDDANVWPVGASEPKKKKRAPKNTDDKRTQEERTFRPGLLPGGQAWGFVAAAWGSRDRIGTFEQVVGRYLKDDSEIPHVLQRCPGRHDPVTGPRPASAFVSRRPRSIGRYRRCCGFDRPGSTSGPAERDTLRLQGEVEAAARRLSSAAANAAQAAEASGRYEAAVTAARSRREEAYQGRPGWWARRRRSETAQDWQRKYEALGAEFARVGKGRRARPAGEGRRAPSGSAGGAGRPRRGPAGGGRRGPAGRGDPVPTPQPRCRGRGRSDQRGMVEAPRGHRVGRADVELATAWMSPRLQQLREELFAAAINVHQTFIRSCGAQIRPTSGRGWRCRPTTFSRTRHSRRPCRRGRASSCWSPWHRRRSRRWPECCGTFRCRHWAGSLSTRPARRCPHRQSAGWPGFSARSWSVIRCSSSRWSPCQGHWSTS